MLCQVGGAGGVHKGGTGGTNSQIELLVDTIGAQTDEMFGLTPNQIQTLQIRIKQLFGTGVVGILPQMVVMWLCRWWYKLFVN